MPRPFSLSHPFAQFLLPDGLVCLCITPIFLFPNISPLLTAVSLSLLALFYLIYPPKPSPFNLLWLVWWLLLGVAVLITADPDLTLPKFTGLMLGFTWWMFLNRKINGRSSLTFGFVFWGLLGFGFVSIGMFSTDWLFKVPGIAAILQRLPTSMVQLPGLEVGVQPNQLAGTLLIYLPFLFSLLIGWRPHRHRKKLLVGTAVLTLFALAVLLLTQSRSSWLGALGGIGVLLALWGAVLPKSRQRWLLWGAVIVIMLTVFVGVFSVGAERIQSIWNNPNQAQETAVGEFRSIGFRQEVWRWGLIASSDFAFTGTGLGTFRHVVRRLYPLNVHPDFDIAHAHNIFLQTALDVGIPGLITYLSILIITAIIGWHTARRSPVYRPFVCGMMASFAALHIYGLTDALALGSKTGLSFWIALGLLTRMFFLQRQESTQLELVDF